MKAKEGENPQKDRTHQLSHALLRLRLTHDVDSKVGEMRSKIGINFGVVAGVAVDI